MPNYSSPNQEEKLHEISKHSSWDIDETLKQDIQQTREFYSKISKEMRNSFERSEECLDLEVQRKDPILE